MGGLSGGRGQCSGGDRPGGAHEPSATAGVPVRPTVSPRFFCPVGRAGGWAAAHLGVFRRHVRATRLSVTDTASVCIFPGGGRAGGWAHVPRTERGGARGDGQIREPGSCPTHTSVAAGATMRLLRHRGGAPPWDHRWLGAKCQRPW